MVKIAKNDARFIRKIGDTNSTFKMHELLADVGKMGKRLKIYGGDARPLITLDEAEFAFVGDQFSGTQTLRVPFKQDGVVRTYNVVINNTNGGGLVVEGYEGDELISMGSKSTTEGVPCLLTIITAYDKEYDDPLALVIKTDIITSGGGGSTTLVAGDKATRIIDDNLETKQIYKGTVINTTDTVPATLPVGAYCFNTATKELYVGAQRDNELVTDTVPMPDDFLFVDTKSGTTYRCDGTTLQNIAAGELKVVNNLTEGGEESALSAEMGKVLNEKIENKGDDVYMVTSSSLADAVAEVPTEDRKVGLVIGLPGEGTSVRRYKYMGKYYTDVDWLSEGAWLDLDNADKYKVYYFRLCPTIEGHVDNASIDKSGEVTTGTKHVTDYIAIPESGVSIGGENWSRYTLYDSGKNKVSTEILYGGKAFTYSSTESAFIRLEYENNTPVWLFGYAKGSSSLPHVEVIEDFENLIDYDDNAWAGVVGPFIRLRKGEIINLLNRGSDTIEPQWLFVQPYNTNQEPYGGGDRVNANQYVMPIDGYVKIGNNPLPAYKFARNNIICKSIARTRAKKRLLVVGDSISVYTWDNALSKDVKQGYPFFLATQGDHELSVTNQARSGNNSAQQLTTLQGKDVSVYDAVTIFIGTNDYGYNISIATFKSNIAAMVDYITAQNPKCKIGFLTLLHRASAWDGTAEVKNGAGAVLSDYCTAIKEVAMTYGLPVLDLWNECQCNFNYTIYKENYSSHDKEASGDGLHPTNEAHKLFLYPLVREFVKRLL